ncbi:MAG: flagellar hook-basal body complex protein, partial [Hyphomonadaceae bacterium]|nr:flagellar hook-basal body complex protein [Clostridia bacterium]
MIQAFYTAASGMYVQQKNIDVISDNITNTSTPGYRVKRAEFKEILNEQAKYQSTQKAIGYGVKIANISTMALPDDVNPFGISIDEKGFFMVEDAQRERSYTKN